MFEIQILCMQLHQSVSQLNRFLAILCTYVRIRTYTHATCSWSQPNEEEREREKKCPILASVESERAICGYGYSPMASCYTFLFSLFSLSLFPFLPPLKEGPPVTFPQSPHSLTHSLLLLHVRMHKQTDRQTDLGKEQRHLVLVLASCWPPGPVPNVLLQWKLFGIFFRAIFYLLLLRLQCK